MLRPSTRDLGIWLVTALLAAIAGALWLQDPALPELTPGIPWPLLAVLFALTERYVVHLPFGRDNHALTFSEAPVVLGLLFASTQDIVMAGVVGVGTVCSSSTATRRSSSRSTSRRRPPASRWRSPSTTGRCGPAPPTPGSRPRTDRLGLRLAGHPAAALFTHVAIFAMISLRQGRWDVVSLMRTLVSAALGTFVVTDLALITALLLVREPAALVLLGIFGVLCFALYRGYHVQRLATAASSCSTSSPARSTRRCRTRPSSRP